MDEEQIVIEVDDRPALEAIKRANAGMDTVDAKAKTVFDNMGRQWNVTGDVVVRVSDRSRNSIDRLIASVEKQASAYNKTGVERLISQRDQLLKRYEGEQRAVDAITKSYGSMIAQQKKLDEAMDTSGAKWNKLLLGAKDIFEGRSGYATVEGGYFIQSLSGIGLAAGAAVAALGGVVIAGREAMKSLGEYAQQTQNVSLRTGLKPQEVEQFAFAAKMGGQEVGIFERMMRGLSEAEDDNSKQGEKARNTLNRLGVTFRDATGAIRPTSDVLLDISKAMDRLPPGVERDAAALDLFKRSGVEAIPVISKLTESIKTAKEMGLGATSEDLARWEQYHEKVTEAGAIWDRFIRHIKEPLAATVILFFKDSENHVLHLDDIRHMGMTVPPKYGGGAQRSESQDWNTFQQQTGVTPPFWIKPDEEQDKLLTFLGGVSKEEELSKKIAAFYKSKGSDVEYQLKQAEEVLAKLPKPIEGKPGSPTPTSDKELEVYVAADKKVTQLKTQVEELHKLREEIKKLEDFEKQSFEKLLTPVEKLYSRRDEFVAAGVGPTRALAATDAANVAASAILAKDDAEWQKTWQASLFRAQEERRRREEEEFKESEKALKLRSEEFVAAVNKMHVALQISDEQVFERSRLTAGFESKAASLGFTSRDELQVFQQQLAVKQAQLAEEMRIKELHVGTYNIDKERREAELENLKDRYAFEEKILEIRHRQYEEVERSTQQLVHTLFTKPSDFGKDLGQTLKEAALKPLESAISQNISRTITPLIFGLDGQGGINGLLKGALGGKTQLNPVIIATDENTHACLANNAAVNANTAQLLRLRTGGEGEGGPANAGATQDSDGMGRSPHGFATLGDIASLDPAGLRGIFSSAEDEAKKFVGGFANTFAPTALVGAAKKYLWDIPLEEGNKATNAFKQGDYLTAAAHTVGSTPGAGVLPDVVQSMVSTGQRAGQDLAAGHPLLAAVHEANATVPVIGPMALQMSDKLLDKTTRSEGFGQVSGIIASAGFGSFIPSERAMVVPERPSILRRPEGLTSKWDVLEFAKGETARRQSTGLKAVEQQMLPRPFAEELPKVPAHLEEDFGLSPQQRVEAVLQRPRKSEPKLPPGVALLSSRDVGPDANLIVVAAHPEWRLGRPMISSQSAIIPELTKAGLKRENVVGSTHLTPVPDTPQPGYSGDFHYIPNPHGRSPGGMYSVGTYVDDAWQRKGITTAMYDFAEQTTGKKIYPSYDLSTKAQAFWKARLGSEEAFGKAQLPTPEYIFGDIEQGVERPWSVPAERGELVDKEFSREARDVIRDFANRPGLPPEKVGVLNRVSPELGKSLRNLFAPQEPLTLDIVAKPKAAVEQVKTNFERLAKRPIDVSYMSPYDSEFVATETERQLRDRPAEIQNRLSLDIVSKPQVVTEQVKANFERLAKRPEFVTQPSVPTLLDSGDLSVPSEPGYAYHGTTQANIYKMRETGVLARYPWEGETNVPRWWDGSLEKRTYFASDAERVKDFYPTVGTPGIIRVDVAKVPLVGHENLDLTRFTMGEDTEYWSTRNIPAHKVETLTNQGWINLRDLPPVTKALELPRVESPKLESAKVSGGDLYPWDAKKTYSEVAKVPALVDSSYFGRHLSLELPKAQATGSVVLKPLYEMSPKELDAVIERGVVEERHLLSSIFGEEGAKRYRQLERTANGSTVRADAAAEELGRMEDLLSKPQQEKLFGINQSEQYDLSAAKSMRSKLGALDDTSAQALGDSMKWALSRFDPANPKADPEAYAQLRYGTQLAHENKYPTADVTKAALKGAYSRFTDQADAEYMLERLRLPEKLSQEVKKTSELKVAPVVNAPELPSTLTQEVLKLKDDQETSELKAAISQLEGPRRQMHVPKTKVKAPTYAGLTGAYSPLGVAEYVVPLNSPELPNDADAMTYPPLQLPFRPARTVYRQYQDKPMTRSHERIHQAQDVLEVPSYKELVDALAPAFGEDKKKSETFIRTTGGTDIPSILRWVPGIGKVAGLGEAPAYLFSQPPKESFAFPEFLKDLGPLSEEGRQKAYNNYINLLKANNPGKEIGVEKVAATPYEIRYLASSVPRIQVPPSLAIPEIPKLVASRQARVTGVPQPQPIQQPQWLQSTWIGDSLVAPEAMVKPRSNVLSHERPLPLQETQEFRKWIGDRSLAPSTATIVANPLSHTIEVPRPSAYEPLYMAPGPASGLIAPGTIDLKTLPVVELGHGQWGTVHSASREVNGQELLYPTIVNRKQLSDNAAFQYAIKTGRNLGTFDNGADADKYSQRLHEDWEAGKIRGVAMRDTPAATLVVKHTIEMPPSAQATPQQLYDSESSRVRMSGPNPQTLASIQGIPKALLPYWALPRTTYPDNQQGSSAPTNAGLLPVFPGQANLGSGVNEGYGLLRLPSGLIQRTQPQETVRSQVSSYGNAYQDTAPRRPDIVGEITPPTPTQPQYPFSIVPTVSTPPEMTLAVQEPSLALPELPYAGLPSFEGGTAGFAGPPAFTIPNLTKPNPIMGVISQLVGGLFGGGGGQGGGGLLGGGGLGGLLGGGGAQQPSNMTLGPTNALGGGGIGSLFSGGGMTNLLGSLKNFSGFGPGTGVDKLGDRWVTNGMGNSMNVGSGFMGGVGAVAASPMASMAGMMLATHGLTGDSAGTLSGTLQGTAGGALIGFRYGGPLGAAIGAGVGLAIGVGEMLAGVESPTREAKRLVKEIYSLNIDTNTAKQIVDVAKQKYAGHVSIAVRDPDVRNMLMLYGEATGQPTKLSKLTPRSATLVEQQGKLYQAPGYQDGKAYTFQSSLPVAGGYATGTYPNPYGSPSSVVLNVGEHSAADLLEGRIASTVTPNYVQDRWSQAGASSNGRVPNAALMQVPGLMIQ